MRLFSVSENGALRKVNKIEFNENKVYLVDDFKTLYLWYGLKASKKKKDFSLKRAKNLNSKREKPAIIEVMNQGEEYGAFLAIMDILRQERKGEMPQVKRNELELEIENTLELVDTGLEMDLEAEITLGAHELLQQKKPYAELCRELAELQIKFLMGKKKITEKEIEKKKEEIFQSSTTYDELCWLIAELNILMEKKSLK